MRILRVNYKGVEPSARFDDSASQEAVSGQIDTIRVIFTFSNEWKQYEKITAVFAGNGQSAGIILDDTMECFVPPFATKKAGYFLVGCFANSKTDKGLVRYPGRNATVKTTTGASVSAVHPDEETVTAYEQLLDRLVLSEENLHKATENANTAANGANSAADNANQEAWNAQLAADRANKAAERVENIAPDAVRITPQTLTEEQQNQARSNIGAAPMSLFKITGESGGDSKDVLTRIATDKSAFTEGKFCSHTSGNLIDNANYACIEDYIAFPAGARLMVHYSGNNLKSSYPIVAYFDENKEFIGGEYGGDLSQEDYNGKLCAFFNVPDGTRFIRLSINTITFTKNFELLFIYIVTEERETGSGVEIPDLIVPELIDIRNGADGTIYESAGDAVRAQTRPLLGKTIVNFGDSIFGNARPPKDISTMLAKFTGATVKNCAFGGCRMAVHTGHWDAFSMYRLAYAVANNDYSLQDEALNYDDRTSYAEAPLALIKETDLSKVDIVTIAYGTNDWTGDNVLDNADNLYDTATVCGALRYSIESLLTAFPQLRIFILLPTYRYWMDADGAFTEDSETKTNSHGKTLGEYNQGIRGVAESYNLPVIDNYKQLGVNKFNRTQYFPANDGTHHNENGRNAIAAHIAKNTW